MAADDRTREDLLAEIAELSDRLDEAEETLRAIGSGEVDALVISGSEGEQVFTLKGAEQPYRVLVESMNEGAATLAADGTILYCNNCLAAMLRVPLERLIGTRLDAYAAPADRPVLAARLECCDLDCSRQEIALVDGDGAAVPVLFSCFDTDLSAGGGRSVVITDLRQQKRNEEIMASERLARSIIEQAGEVIIVCDEDGRIIRSNRLANQLCGRNPLLKPFDELFHLFISETDCMFSVATPLHGGCYESVEVKLNQADGEVVYLLLNATPLLNDLNRIIGCVVSLADISERKRAEETLNRAHDELEKKVEERTMELNRSLTALRNEISGREKLEQQLRQSQKLESIGLLAGGVAHDFNNLLTGIGGYAQLIEECAGPDPELQESVTQLMSGVDRAAELTRSLLAFSRKQELNRQPAMIDGIIDKAGKFIRRVIGEDIEFRTVFGGNDLLVLVDAGQIEQVLLNLAINARDAMPHGGCLTISVSRTVVKEGSQPMYDLPLPGNYARISVTDTGAGIDRTTMERIFEPFYTTKAIGKGTGLGLSIVHGIIKQHDGSILVSSEPARGATFDIYLPMVEGQGLGEETQTSESVSGGTETLLIAEDEEIVKTLLKRTLERAGYRVLVAADGNEALERFREHDEIAMVLSDVVMPGKNGKEILAEIRGIRPGMKFIFISGYTADIIRERGMGVIEMGAEIMTKPFSKYDLLRKVREVLDRD